MVKYLDDVLVKYSPPSPAKSALDAALKKAGIVYTANAYAFSFSDKKQLLAAAQIYASRLVDGDITRYRIASTEAGVQALRQAAAQAMAAAKPRANASGTPVTTVSPPARTAPVQDAGAAVPNACDQQAADPKDRRRMAPGLLIASIAPLLALQECERAVAQYPSTARLRYQLGRAQEASHNFTAAIASYQQAAAMNYPMAWYNLGMDYAEGSGVAPDYTTAEAYLRKAMAAGVDARTELQDIVFNPDGYSDPQFFSAVFEGSLNAINAKAVSVYLGEFMVLFYHTEGCQNVISTYALSRLLQTETFGTLGQLFGAIANPDRSGWNAGMSATNGLMLQVSKARADAQLFYDRHGCDSPVSRQFFKNIQTLALGS